MSSWTNFGANYKIAEFKAADFLSGDVAATDVLVAKQLSEKLQVEGKTKVGIKAVVL